MKQNAMTDQAKQQRRHNFIAAARRLFLQQQRLPAVADIAADTGLAKGTVYRYFRSKEEIFIAMLQDDFAALFAALTPVIAGLSDDAEQAAANFAQAYSRQLQQLPTLLPLAAMLNAVLEHKLSTAVLKQFKQLLAGALQQSGQLLASRVKTISAAEGSTLLLHNYALTLGLWQTLQYPPAVQLLLQHEPELRSLQRDFTTELTAAIAQQWLGALR
jgi:AcrR family transcriptional regulator